jgi:hypothetical protein
MLLLKKWRKAFSFVTGLSKFKIGHRSWILNLAKDACDLVATEGVGH